MNLPDDIARCIGHAYDAPESICRRRDTCQRYTDPVSSGLASYLHPQVPGPCIYYREPQAEGPQSGTNSPCGEAKGEPSKES